MYTSPVNNDFVACFTESSKAYFWFFGFCHEIFMQIMLWVQEVVEQIVDTTVP